MWTWLDPPLIPRPCRFRGDIAYVHGHLYHVLTVTDDKIAVTLNAVAPIVVPIFTVCQSMLGLARRLRRFTWH